jgi:hypothetical protein
MQRIGLKEHQMKLRKAFIILPILTGFGLVSVVQAQEKKLKREELPAAVEKTVAEQSNGATIRGFSTEIENGQTIYEAELIVNGHQKDISMDEHGKIIEVEEEVAMDSLPPAVTEGLRKIAGTGVISKVESLTKNGKLVAYEAEVRNENKRSEIQVGPDGKKVAHPE